jgi:phosphoglycolate phosphatase
VTGAIVFDLDGTLIDSAPDIHAATNALLAEEGLPFLGFTQVCGFIGAGVAVLVTRVLDALGEDPGGPRHADLVRRFEARYETAHGLTRVYPGVLPALTALRGAGHRLGICTNKPLTPTRAALAHFGLAPFFDVVIGGDSLPVRKPDPAPLHAAFAALGPACLYVGDSEVDAETAQRAGARFALFTQGYRKTEIAALPHWRAFDGFDALPGIVAALR